MLVDPRLEQARHMFGAPAQAPTAERAHDKRLALVRDGDVHERLDTLSQGIVALALRAMVLQGTRAQRLGDGDDVRLAHGPRERDIGQIRGTIREQLAAAVIAVGVVEGFLDAAEHLIQVALRTEDLLGTGTSRPRRRRPDA